MWVYLYGHLGSRVSRPLEFYGGLEFYGLGLRIPSAPWPAGCRDAPRSARCLSKGRDDEAGL